MDSAVVLERIKYLILLLLSLTVHEFFHAFTAWRLGDDTAARSGRLTLNPIPHIDLFGTILFPMLGMPIGWAKPVPVNPSRFTRRISMGLGDIITSAAGPLSNLALALLSAVVLGLLARLAPATLDAPGVAGLLDGLILVNAGLFVFNLLPIPPLDGSHVVASIIPYRYRGAWDTFAQYAPFVLFALVWFGGTGRFITGPIYAVYGLFHSLAAAIA